MTSIVPIITFKAGICDVDTSTKPYKVKARPQKGYVYLYSEDDLIHFCWRERNAALDQPELDLVMVPTDGHFVPHESSKQTSAAAKTNGRIFVLKFMSSSQRHLFWLQSKPQGRRGDPAWFSPRDLKIGEIVDALLQGEEVNVQAELASVVNNNNDEPSHDDDDDETMEDVEGRRDSSDPHGGAGGAGPDATGGDLCPLSPEEAKFTDDELFEGKARPGVMYFLDVTIEETTRRARVPCQLTIGDHSAAGGNIDAETAVRNFLNSLKGGSAGASQGGEGKLFPMLSDLLTPPTTVPMVQNATEEKLDELLSFLPPSILILSQQGDSGSASAEPTASAVEAAKQAMSIGQKKALLEKVLRSPQFHQSLTSLTMALRDGGLPTVADALSIKVENGGYMKGSSMPLGGGEAVEAFVEGVKKTVEEKK
ncbi:proteasome complex subunit Rpn13 ubiquitin receptor-domain-containing protein [Xylariales sp. PMI_506]|nr:proteasome complex subunit Rpn13 ubiquitin receptor-domain-containing protein [Xylariales sp. PMI_506]